MVLFHEEQLSWSWDRVLGIKTDPSRSCGWRVRGELSFCDMTSVEVGYGLCWQVWVAAWP